MHVNIMLLINFEKKAIYVPLPKTGQKYISHILTTFYGFIEWENQPDEIADYFHNDESLVQSLDNYDNKYYSITDKGLVRFCLHDSLDNVDNKQIKYFWNTFFKFTFINNPYRKFVSAYLFSTNIGYETDVFPNSDICNDQIYRCKLKDFIMYKNDLPNLCLYTTFISQKNHLIDDNGAINFQYIGQTSDLDYELIMVLNHLGFNDMKHLNINRASEKIVQKFETIDNFQHYIDNECISELNSIIADDIELFNFDAVTNKDDIKKYPNKYTCNDATKTAKSIFDSYEKQLIIDSNSILTNILKEHIESNDKLLYNYFNIDKNNLLINQHRLLVNKYFKATHGNNNLNTAPVSDISCMHKSLKLDKFNCDKCKFCCYNSTAFLCHYKTYHDESIEYNIVDKFIDGETNNTLFDLNHIHGLGYNQAYYENETNKNIVVIPNFFSNDVCNYIIDIGTHKENNQECDESYMNNSINVEIKENSHSKFTEFLLSKYNIDRNHFDNTTTAGFRCSLKTEDFKTMQYNDVKISDKLVQLIGHDMDNVSFPDTIEDNVFGMPIIRDQSIVHYKENEGIPPHIDETKYTMLCYLNDVEDGGRTIFPQDDIAISPKKGTVVLYSSTWDLLHYSEKIKSGEKWIMQVLID